MSSEIQVGYANPDLSKNPSLMEKSRFDRYFAAAPNGQTCGWTVSLNFGPTVGLAFGPTVKLNPKLNSKLNSKLNPNLDVDIFTEFGNTPFEFPRRALPDLRCGEFESTSN